MAAPRLRPAALRVWRAFRQRQASHCGPGLLHLEQAACNAARSGQRTLTWSTLCRRASRQGASCSPRQTMRPAGRQRTPPRAATAWARWACAGSSSRTTTRTTTTTTTTTRLTATAQKGRLRPDQQRAGSAAAGDLRNPRVLVTYDWVRSCAVEPGRCWVELVPCAAACSTCLGRQLALPQRQRSGFAAVQGDTAWYHGSLCCTLSCRSTCTMAIVHRSHMDHGHMAIWYACMHGMGVLTPQFLYSPTPCQAFALGSHCDTVGMLSANSWPVCQWPH